MHPHGAPPATSAQVARDHLTGDDIESDIWLRLASAEWRKNAPQDTLGA